MTRKEIREELVRSGAENINKEPGGEDRLNRWIQQSIRELCDYKPWPFLYAVAEGPAPLTIADLGHVVAVLFGRTELEPITLNQHISGDPTLSAKGPPGYWYTEDNITIKVAPANTGTIKVPYRKVPTVLADNGVPIVPVDYHDLIVDRARVKVLKATDNYEAAAELLKDYERQRDLMVHALMKPNYDRERRLTRTGSGGDYL